MEIFSKTFSTVLRLAQDACPWRSSAREHHLRSTRALIIQDRLFSRTLDMEYCSCSAAETSAQLLHLRSCLSRPSRRRAAGLTRGYEFAASAQPGASGAAGLCGRSSHVRVTRPRRPALGGLTARHRRRRRRRRLPQSLARPFGFLLRRRAGVGVGVGDCGHKESSTDSEKKGLWYARLSLRFHSP